MLLSVRDLAVRFRTEDGIVHAVNGVSFDVERGETVGIVGESGCGKSATSLAILRLLPQTGVEVSADRIDLEGRDLLTATKGEMRALRGRDVAMVFQDPMTSLNPVLTIGRQLRETIAAHGAAAYGDTRATAIELLQRVGIPEPETALRRYPHQLSGGMRQRVMIAMALALKPKLLIADEPTTALDVTIQAQVLDLIRRLTRESNTAVVLITHDLGLVASMARRVIVMYAGMVAETGATEDLFDKPAHPYTLGLLNSLPRLDGSREAELVPIEGSPPDQLALAPGCPFAPRCARRIERCLRETPGLTQVEGRGLGHAVACFNPLAAGLA
ncbi:MAG: ABC transporter ATP-binding protein [Alphaproteobacteria bacterium]